MQLVGMMRGIAYGMQYLAEMNYVHRYRLIFHPLLKSFKTGHYFSCLKVSNRIY